MFKIEITEKGVHMAVDGKEQEVPVGAQFEFKEVPRFLTNKHRVVSSSKDKTLVTKGSAPDEKPDVEALRAKYTELTGGKQAPGNWGAPKLTAAIEELSNGDGNNG